jgi:hypothetical protein
VRVRAVRADPVRECDLGTGGHVLLHGMPLALDVLNSLAVHADWQQPTENDDLALELARATRPTNENHRERQDAGSDGCIDDGVPEGARRVHTSKTKYDSLAMGSARAIANAIAVRPNHAASASGRR